MVDYSEAYIGMPVVATGIYCIGNVKKGSKGVIVNIGKNSDDYGVCFEEEVHGHDTSKSILMICFKDE